MYVCTYVCKHSYLCTNIDTPHVTGIVRRRCIMDDLWEEFIECFREETSMLFDQVTDFNLKIYGQESLMYF